MRIGFLARNSLSLLLRRRLSFQFDRIPMQAHNISGRKLFNLGRIALNRVLPVSRTLGYPYMAHISPSGVCDLSCDLCPSFAPETRGKQLLPFDTFKKFIDETGDYLLYIILWSWGEPLLNPEIYKMIAYAKERNILSVTSSNLNRLSREDARALVSSGLDALIVRKLQPVADLAYDRQRLSRAHLARRQQLPQVRTVDVLHQEVEELLPRAEVVNHHAAGVGE